MAGSSGEIEKSIPSTRNRYGIVSLDRKNLEEKSFTASVDGTEVSGRIGAINHKGCTVRMTDPFPGLTAFVPFIGAAAEPSAEAAVESKVREVLSRLYKKAVFYLENREEIDKKYDDYLAQLQKKHVEENKEKRLGRFLKKRRELESALQKGKLKEQSYRRKRNRDQRKLLNTLYKINSMQQRLEEQSFPGTLKAGDIEKFRAYFSSEK